MRLSTFQTRVGNVKEGKIELEKVVDKMSHAVARCFQVKERGFIREGHHADLVLASLDKSVPVTRENILYKCGWSPLEKLSLPLITHTFVNGHLVYGNGVFDESQKGMRLRFNR